MKYFLATYGCKTNQYESAALAEALGGLGWLEAADPADADVLIANTCAVTARASRDGGRDWRRARRRNPLAPAVLTGCAVDLDEAWTRPAECAMLNVQCSTHGAETGNNPPFLRFRNRDKALIPERLTQLTENKATPRPLAVHYPLSAAIPADPRFAFEVSRFAVHARAFLKIQDGCANACAYCVVPQARGAPASRDPAAVFAEAGRLAAGGHSEIALTGINIGDYNAGGGRGLAWLARELARRTPGLARLRLGSVEPPALTDELVGAMAECPAICPHIHLPLQSGDNGVLAAMNRRYRADGFRRAVRRLRQALDRPAVTTDVIVGFPEEDADAFARTADFCRELAFSRLHVFPWSPRPGTSVCDGQPAAAPVMAGRRRRLARLGEELAQAYAERFVGETVEVVAESEEDGVTRGYTGHYVPARLAGGPWHPGAVARVRAVRAIQGGLRAERI